MNLPYLAYALFSSCFVVIVLPFYWVYKRIIRRERISISQRLGIYSWKLNGFAGTPRIWIHAVSVGEVNVAAAVIHKLKNLIPGCGIVLSTTTPHGQAAAVNRVGRWATCIYAPVDFIPSVQKALSFMRPDILVCLETEIWPNWLMAAQRMGIKTAFINGRISVRSIRGYLRIRPLVKTVLSRVDAFSMIHASDAQRIKLLGAPPERITVSGNAKYDGLSDQAGILTREIMAKLYRVKSGQPVLLAGSTRGKEGEICLKVFRQILSRFPGALMIIAPRHLKRTDELMNQAKALGFSCQFRTDINGTDKPRTASVVILNTIGELQETYSIASVVFCGGSLVPLGGQNVLEAAIWGKPVFYGPSMEDFLEAKELLESVGGGFPVTDSEDLTVKLAAMLSNPEALEAAGLHARRAVLSRRGAALAHARVIQKLLQGG